MQRNVYVLTKTFISLNKLVIYMLVVPYFMAQYSKLQHVNLEISEYQLVHQIFMDKIVSSTIQRPHNKKYEQSSLSLSLSGLILVEDFAFAFNLLFIIILSALEYHLYFFPCSLFTSSKFPSFFTITQNYHNNIFSAIIL